MEPRGWRAVQTAMKLTDVVRLRGFALGLSYVVVTAGCAGTRPNTTTTPQGGVMEMDEIHISAGRGERGYQFEAYDAAELFSRATDLLNQQKCREAVALYDKVVQDFSTSRYASAAAYNAGLCLQALGDFGPSAERYARVRDSYPESEDRRDASFQLAEVSVQLARWDSVVQLADELLALPDLTPAERLEAMARRGQGLLGQKRLEEAESYARGALAYFRAQPASDPIRDEFFAAACSYVVAESFRERAQAMRFPADAEGQKQVLLRRAELVLQAQNEYLTTIGFKNLDNYHWAAASGYRIGSMYDELWRSVTQAPVPANLPTSAAGVYHAELAKLIKPLLRNAIRYWEATQLSIERAGIKTAWAEKIDADLARLRAQLMDDGVPAVDPTPASSDPSAQPERPPALPSPAVQTPRPAANPAPATSAPHAAPAPRE